jgi:hypothetical protein
MRATIKVLLLHTLWVMSRLEDTRTLCLIMALAIVRYHQRYLPSFSISLPALFPVNTFAVV